MNSQVEAWPRPGAALKGGFLLFVCTACLVAFYYLVRADAIGVFAPGRGWTQLTRGPLGPTGHLVGAAVVLALLPVLAARRLTGLTLRDLGLGLGKWREGLLWLALGVPLAVLAGWLGSRSPVMRAVYPLDPSLTPDAVRFIPYALAQFLYFGAWEVLFRGVLLFGLRGRTGDGLANAVQTGLSVTAHFGRALDETAAALGAGALFGWITLRTGSVWYLAVVHWLVGVSLDWFIVAT
ncbi:MAG TPA: CPBP family intramembrane glutamic endopeptidase [Gemmatimonadales bacterium]